MADHATPLPPRHPRFPRRLALPCRPVSRSRRRLCWQAQRQLPAWRLYDRDDSPPSHGHRAAGRRPQDSFPLHRGCSAATWLSKGATTVAAGGLGAPMRASHSVPAVMPTASAPGCPAARRPSPGGQSAGCTARAVVRLQVSATAITGMVVGRIPSDYRAQPATKPIGYCAIIDCRADLS